MNIFGKKNQDITQILNHITSKSIRWCTPSIEVGQERVGDPYLSDISVSFEGLGFPSEPSGMFLSAYERAAKVYKSDRTLFSVNGSTGSNFIVLRTLAKQIPNLRVLAQRNIHKSVLHACQDYGINLLFVEPHIDSHLQIFLPNSIGEIVQSVRKTKPHVLLITNPTYEGLTINLQKLIQEVHKINSSLIVFIDEAWGAHLTFSGSLPSSAMQSGADICVQSTHKQGGALQQTSMIHWKEKRINSNLLLESYRNLSTSSPSYLLLASLDAACSQMDRIGKKIIDKSLKIAKKLSEELETIPGFRIISLRDLKDRSSTTVFNKDETKVIVDISESGYTGFEMAKLLEEKYNIILEKYNTNTILFLIPFQSKLENVSLTINAIKDLLQNQKPMHSLFIGSPLEIPKCPRILELGEVAKLLRNQVEAIPLKEARGRISAENITPYPPGIPTTIQGEEFTSKAIVFYENIRLYPNSHVIAQDISLQTVLVVK